MVDMATSCSELEAWLLTSSQGNRNMILFALCSADELRSGHVLPFRRLAN